ncbi:MAG: hypothetical protein QM762_07745 [Chryseolinea sp.]
MPRKRWSIKLLELGSQGTLFGEESKSCTAIAVSPYVRLSDEVKALAEKLGITDWFISISYTEEVAFASVIAVGN